MSNQNVRYTLSVLEALEEASAEAARHNRRASPLTIKKIQQKYDANEAIFTRMKYLKSIGIYKENTLINRYVRDNLKEIISAAISDENIKLFLRLPNMPSSAKKIYFPDFSYDQEVQESRGFRSKLPMRTTRQGNGNHFTEVPYCKASCSVKSTRTATIWEVTGIIRTLLAEASPVDGTTTPSAGMTNKNSD